MAQRVITQLVDDITGEEINAGGKTIRFSVDGGDWQIDLNEKNAKKFYETMKFYQDHATHLGGRGKRTRVASKASNKEELAAIRRWARDAGYEVSDRGRIKQEIVDAYHAARG